MKLVCLGTAGYHPSNHRHTACFAIPEAGIVLDAGTGMYRLRELLTTSHLDIFLTHSHLDHVVGLTYLLGILHGKPMQRVTVHGEPSRLETVREHLFAPLIFPVPPSCEFRPLQQNAPLSGGGRLTWFPLLHPGGSVGFRLDWPGHSLAYVTDTTAAADSPYVHLVRGVDLLVHECNFPDEYAELANVSGHSTTTPVADLARRAGVGRLLLVHLNPATDADDPVGLDVARAIFPATELGQDLLEVEF